MQEWSNLEGLKSFEFSEMASLGSSNLARSPHTGERSPSSMFGNAAHNRIALGSRNGLLFMRVGEAILVCLFGLSVPYFHPLSVAVISLAIVAGFLTKLHEFAFGFADESGIRFRRYFRWHFLPWRNVESITRESKITISLRLENKNLFNRTLRFFENPEVRNLMRESHIFHDVRDAWIEGREAK
jgi:hypothetical protein